MNALDKLRITVSIASAKNGEWTVGISAKTRRNRMRYVVTGRAHIRRLPDGLFAAGRVLENNVIPKLQELIRKNEEAKCPAKP